MSERSKRGADQADDGVWSRYRVVADITPDGEHFQEMTTEWTPNRGTVVRTMEQLQADGHLAEIETRTVHTAVDADDVPGTEGSI